MTRMADEFLLTVTQLCARLELRERVVIAWVHREQIPHIKIGTELRFRWKDIEAWIEAQTKSRPATLPVGQSVTKGIHASPDDTSEPVLRLSRGAKGRNRERLAT
jgi:excisionase family DNA binding protein